MNGRVAFVTGASSGIGAAVARAFGAIGFQVALGARRTDRLEAVAAEVEAAGGRAFPHVLDVADEASADAFFDAAEKGLGPVDVLVNNAGINQPNLLADAKPADLRREIETNLVGPMLLARRAVRSLRARAAPGDLVFVTSQNAVAPRPYQPAYTASKWGLEGLAHALKLELEGTGVRSTIVRPGPTGSEFGSGWDQEVLHRALRAWKYWGVQRRLHWLEADDVARAVVAVVTAPPGMHMDVVQVMPEAKPGDHGRSIGVEEDTR